MIKAWVVKDLEMEETTSKDHYILFSDFYPFYEHTSVYNATYFTSYEKAYNTAEAISNACIFEIKEVYNRYLDK